MSITIDGDLGISGVDGTAASPAIRGNDSNTGISYGTDIVTINTGGVARVTTDASGNVGIGTASPFNKLTVAEPSTSSGVVFIGNAVNTSNAEYGRIRFGSTASSSAYVNYAGQIASFSIGGIDTGDLRFYTSAGAPSTEKARIDSSGNLLVGTTGTNPVANRVNGNGFLAAGGLVVRCPSGNSYLGLNATSGNHLNFYTDNGSAFVSAGNISSNGGTTTYNSSSDYRMKENVQPMVGALNKVLALKPVTYTWKPEFAGTNENGQGFIAHELQAVVPDCVTGEKDAVETVDDLDAEGKKIGTKEVPRYQGVDTSFLVATLVAAIQEQQATIAAMETRLAALEA